MAEELLATMFTSGVGWGSVPRHIRPHRFQVVIGRVVRAAKPTLETAYHEGRALYLTKALDGDHGRLQVGALALVCSILSFLGSCPPV